MRHSLVNPVNRRFVLLLATVSWMPACSGGSGRSGASTAGGTAESVVAGAGTEGTEPEGLGHENVGGAPVGTNGTTDSAGGAEPADVGGAAGGTLQDWPEAPASGGLATPWDGAAGGSGSATIGGGATTTGGRSTEMAAAGSEHQGGDSGTLSAGAEFGAGGSQAAIGAGGGGTGGSAHPGGTGGTTFAGAGAGAAAGTGADPAADGSPAAGAAGRTGGSTPSGGAGSPGASTPSGGSTSSGGAPEGGGQDCTVPRDFDSPVGYAAAVDGGGDSPPVEAASMQDLSDALDAYDGSSGLVIRYTGVFDFSTIADPCDQFEKAAQVVDVKDVSNVSILGAPGSSMNFGLHFVRATNVVIRNLTIGLLPGKADAIGIENGCSGFWIDHNELFSSLVECEGAGDLEFDGLLDIKNNSSDMTFSYNYFHDHHKVGLMGSSDSDTNDWRVTLHNNWYENVGSRLPLQRGGHTHLFNNYYDAVTVSGANIRMGGLALIESNYFENAKNPVTSRDSSTIGYWDLRDNYVGSGIEWSDADDPFANADDWATTEPFGSVPYAYTAVDASCVKAIVTATAGARL